MNTMHKKMMISFAVTVFMTFAGGCIDKRPWMAKITYQDKEHKVYLDLYKAFSEMHQIQMKSAGQPHPDSWYRKKENRLKLLNSIIDSKLIYLKAMDYYREKQESENKEVLSLDQIIDFGKKKLIAQVYFRRHIEKDDITVTEEEIKDLSGVYKEKMSQVPVKERRRRMIAMIKRQKFEQRIRDEYEKLRENVKVEKNLELLRGSMEPQEGDAKKVLLKVGSKEISLVQFKHELDTSFKQLVMRSRVLKQKLPYTKQSKELQQKVIDNITGVYLVHQKAVDEGIPEEEEVKTQIELTVVNAVVKRYIVETADMDNFEPSQEQLEQVYDLIISKRPELRNLHTSKILKYAKEMLKRQHLKVHMMTVVKNLRDEALIKKNNELIEDPDLDLGTD